jgi:hypothetical protein
MLDTHLSPVAGTTGEVVADVPYRDSNPVPSSLYQLRYRVALDYMKAGNYWMRVHKEMLADEMLGPEHSLNDL